MSDLNQQLLPRVDGLSKQLAELRDGTVSPSAADEINNSFVFEDRELPGGSSDDECSENASEQHITESDHDDVAVHIVDEIQSEGEKEEENHLR